MKIILNRHFRPFFGFGMLLGVVRNQVYVIQACSLLNSKVELPRAWSHFLWWFYLYIWFGFLSITMLHRHTTDYSLPPCDLSATQKKCLAALVVMTHILSLSPQQEPLKCVHFLQWVMQQTSVYTESLKLSPHLPHWPNLKFLTPFTYFFFSTRRLDAHNFGIHT